MLKKIVLVLIVISVIVIIAALYFLREKDSEISIAVREDTTLRSTESGQIVGFIDVGGVRAWLGVPYAKPPVGELRWQAPERPEPSGGLVETLHFSEPCPQFSSILTPSTSAKTNGIVGSEDCLYLNIWSAPNSVNAPVMLWLHGGGNSAGTANSYNGSRLASTQNVVVVTINYRLGILGWFHHPDLGSDALARSGNFGLLDIMQALKWTRNNIGNFGGDSENITVFGESAGGFNVLGLMASPLAEGLFQQAIVQSGGFSMRSLSVASDHLDEGGHEFSSKEILSKLLVRDGSARTKIEAKTIQDAWAAEELSFYLLSKNSAELLSVFDENRMGMVNAPTMFADGHVLPDMEVETIFGLAENYNQIPVILGSNRDEPALFMAQDPRYVNTTFGVFNRLKDESDYLKRVYYGALAWKATGVDQLAEVMLESGNEDVYAYRFDWDEERSVMFYDLSVALGAAHGLEIPFVFGRFSGGFGLEYMFPNDDAQTALSDQMMTYWANFARNGNPNGTTVQMYPWIRWGEQGKTSIILDTLASGGIRMMESIVTLSSIKQELLADQEFSQPQTKCEIYTLIFYQTDDFDTNEFASIGCEDFDPDSVSIY